MRRLHVLTVACAASVACAQPAPRAETAPQARPAVFYGYTVVNSFPHDPAAFTQGLIFRDGFLYESTGRNGLSSVRKVQLETGEILQKHDVDERYFGEGLTDWNERLVQLTWQTNIAFVYDLATFAERGTFQYTGEGWGLTHDRERLIMSDGTTRLRFFDPTTFREQGSVEVRDADRAIEDLNELEFVSGEVYANVWLTDRIATIDPASGRVTAWIDLTGLRPSAERVVDDVLNGIAYDAATDRLFVTGKLWPRLFEIRVRR